MDIVSYILSKAYVDKTLDGMGALKGAPCTISSIVDNPDGTHDITFSWKDNSDVTHTSILTVANGETPTITSTEIEGGHTLTFATTDPSQSVSFNVMDGEEGERGVSVIRANVDANNYLTLTLSDGNIINAGQIKTVSMVDNTLSIDSPNPVENRVITSELNKKVNKVSGKQLSTEDFTTAEKNKLANIENGAQVNVLENLIINGEEATIVDKKIALTIITSAVSNLQNYYLKSETYTKTEVEELIGSTVGVTIEIVQELPTIGQTNVIYFLPTETANVYSQYIYTANDGWVLIGSTSVDLSNYYTKGQVDTLLNGKQNVLTIDAFPTSMSNNPVASGGVYSAIAQMQPQFQFTNMPTADASNFGFVYQYIGNAGTYEPNMFYRCVYNSYAGEYRWEEVIFHSTITVDNELSLISTNPVQNKVITEALSTKQDIMQFSTMPSAQANLGKIVQYTGATTATYRNACFYKATYDGEHDEYVWVMVKFSADISVDNVLSDVSENPVQNKVITNKFDEYETSFTGTQDEWDALTTEQQNVYDIYNIIDDGSVLNLGIYLEKKTVMPVASEEEEYKVYLYIGETTQYYKKGVVYQCVSDGQDPATYSWVALIDFGTAALKNSTDRVSPNNTDLVESQSVYSAINTALSSIYTPRGDISCAELTSDLLIAANVGNIYETSDSGTTTALFLQGAGHPIATGSNVGIINAGQGRILFNLMANAFDLTDYQKIDLTQAVEGATTVEGALGALSTNKQSKDLTTAVESVTTVEGALSALSTNKASKIANAINNHIVAMDANGEIKDSGLSILTTAFTDANDCLPIEGRIDTWYSCNDQAGTTASHVPTNLRNPNDGYPRRIYYLDAILVSGGIVQVCYVAYMENKQYNPWTTDVFYRFGANNGSSYTYSSWSRIAINADIIAKADKVSSATAGDIATLDVNGNLVDSGISTNGFVKTGVISTSSGDGYKKVEITTSEAYLNGRFYLKDRRGNEYVIMIASGYPTAFYRLARVSAIREYIVEVRQTRGHNGRLNVFIHSLDFDTIGYTFIGCDNVNIAVSDSDATEFATGTAITWQKFATDSDIADKQPKTLDTPIKIGGIDRTSVETALGALNNWKVSTLSRQTNFGEQSGDIYAFLDKCVEIGALKKNTQMSFVLTPIYDHTFLWTFTDLNNFRANRCTIKFNGYYSVSSVDNTANTFSLEIISWVDHVIYYYFEDRPNYGGPHNWRTVSTNPYYSTSEVFTGKYWIDGNPIYRKVVDIGALPNNTLKTVAHGITNIDTITDYYGMVASTSKTALKIPYVATESLDTIAMYVSITNVALRTKQDMSTYSGYAVVEYTKTTA